MIRVGGADPASGGGATSTSATKVSKSGMSLPSGPVVSVPARGIVVRARPDGAEKCNGYAAGKAFTVVDVPKGSDWVFDAESAVWLMSAAEQADGECPSSGRTHGSVSPGRYLVGFSSSNDQHQTWTFSIHPEKVDPLLHAEIPANLPIEERVVDEWFPFATLADARLLVAAAPRQLFVFAPQGTHATVERDRSDDLDGVKSPTFTVQPNEPLLRMSRSKGVFLASDLSVVVVPSESGEPAPLAAPAGAVVIPPVRNAWAKFDELLPKGADVDALPEKLKKDVLAYTKLLHAKEDCFAAARRRYDGATEGVILTQPQRLAAQSRKEADDRACGPMVAELASARARLRPQLLELRTAKLQAIADGVKPHLTEAFATR